MRKKFHQLTFWAVLFMLQHAGGQTTSALKETAQNPPPEPPPCAKPANVFDMDDYDGPFNKIVARFTHKLDIKTVHLPRLLRPHVHVCSLNAGDKFHLFMEDTLEPVNFVGAGWDAGWAQLANDDPTFGQGAAGYGKRYGAALTDNFSDSFFNTFFYPALFREDPRYFRVAHGPVKYRLFHAMRHVFVAHSDSGHLMPNFSEWVGTASAKALSNLYHPGNERGFGTTAQRTGISVSTDMAWNVVKEFWPEITKKLRLPFKTPEEQEPVSGSVAEQQH